MAPSSNVAAAMPPADSPGHDTEKAGESDSNSLATSVSDDRHGVAEEEDDDDKDAVAGALGRAVRGLTRSKARTLARGIPARIPKSTTRTIAKGADRLAQAIDFHGASAVAAEDTVRHQKKGWRVRFWRGLPVFASQLAKSTVLGTVLFDGFEAACNVLPPQNEGSSLHAAFPRLADFWDGLSRWYTFTGVDAAFFGGMAAGALHGTLSVAWDNTATSAQRLWKNRRKPQALLNPATTVASRAAAKPIAAAAIGPSLHGTILSHMLFHATLFGTFAGIMAVVREAGLDSEHSITRKDVMREMQERSFARLPGRRRQEESGGAVDAAARSVHRDEHAGESSNHFDSSDYAPNLSESDSNIGSGNDEDDDDDDDDDDGHALQLVAAVGVAGAIAGVASEIVAVATAPWEVQHGHHTAASTPPPHPIAHKFELFHSALRAPGAVRGVLLSGILSGALGFLAYEFADL